MLQRTNERHTSANISLNDVHQIPHDKARVALEERIEAELRQEGLRSPSHQAAVRLLQTLEL
jgi:hypothetical protein